MNDTVHPLNGLPEPEVLDGQRLRTKCLCPVDGTVTRSVRAVREQCASVRQCRWCDAELEGLRQAAKYYSVSCRVMASRARRRQGQLLIPPAPADALQGANQGLQGVNSGRSSPYPNHPRPPGATREQAHVASGDFVLSVLQANLRTSARRSQDEKRLVALGEAVGSEVMRPAMSERAQEPPDRPRDF